MLSIRKILCPTDFSEFSDRALVYATDLAVRFKAKLYVQHVKEDAYMLAYNALPQDIQTMALAYEHDVAERLNQRLSQEKELDYHTIVIRGSSHQEIVNAAREHAIDLIVMGTRGRTGLERLVLGSVTAQVVRKAPCPVLTVCHVAAEKTRRPLDFRTILVPVDFSEYSLRALEYALALAQDYRSTLSILHVIEHVPEPVGVGLWSDPAPYREQYTAAVRERLAHLIPEDIQENDPVEILVKTGRSEQEIVATAKEADADLIVMGIVGQGAIKSALFGSTAYRVITEAHCPVLTVRRRTGGE